MSKKKLQTVKIDFESTDHQSKSVAEGIKICQVLYRNVEVYRHRQRIIQCYRCYQFGHIARLCPDQENQTCRDCGGRHHFSSCTRRTKKCVNCGGEHAATDPVCEWYQDIAGAMKHRLETRHDKRSTTNLLSRTDFEFNY